MSQNSTLDSLSSRKVNKTAISLLFLLLFVFQFLQAQKLPDSRKTSYYTYIYKITNEEAKQVYKKNLWQVDSTFFHTLCDSFPTDSKYTRQLAPGYYLKTYANKDRQEFSFAAVPAFDVKILNNNTDLVLRVYSLSGDIISDAKVSVRGKILRFDKKTQCYIHKKSNKKGLVTVTHNGFTSYHKLNREKYNPFIRRAAKTTVFETPLRYAWIPVNLAIHIPLDLTRSIIYRNPRGWVYHAREFTINSAQAIGCIFDNYYCDYNEYKFRQKHDGYLVFNKPKYLPGDTVKLKAFITRKGKPVDKKVNLVLGTHKKRIHLTTLEPYHPGGYHYSFLLHDSLDLLLDRSYSVYFEDKHERTYLSDYFQYEDYELGEIQMELDFADTKQYKDLPFHFTISGKDANDLNLLDARYEILAKPKSISEYFSDQVFIRDTLFHLSGNLESNTETKIIIPDSLFPPVNMDYEIKVDLRTSDNELLTKNKTIEYYHKHGEIDFAMGNDSLKISSRKNGREVGSILNIYSIDNFGNERLIMREPSPVFLPIEPHISSYRAESGLLKNTFDPGQEASLLTCISERDKDTVKFVVNNPRNLSFTYNIYCRNKEIERGHTDSLSFGEKSNSLLDYYISVRYLWGGKIKEDTYRVPYLDNKLNITVTQPPLVFPGQKVPIKLKVTDVNGNPVKGADLTAYSLTTKFDYSPPVVPEFTTWRKKKTIVNNFHFEDGIIFKSYGLKLNYPEWKIMAGLDTIEYYKFIYPAGEMYRYEYTPDNGITQFSPFVMDGGSMKPVHIIYVDNRPVFFSWNTNDNPYSFRIEPGYHKIRLRTNYHEITLDSVYFEKNKKLLFSINLDSLEGRSQIEKVKPVLSDYERRMLNQYIFPYRGSFQNEYAYLKDGENIHYLRSTSGYNFHNMTGPVAGDVSFHMVDSFALEFKHEPYFEYEFQPQLLKMRSTSTTTKLPRTLNQKGFNHPLSDEVMTVEEIFARRSFDFEHKRMRNRNICMPDITNIDRGLLNLELPKNDSTFTTPLNILVFKTHDLGFLRIYPGNVRTIHNLTPGSYKLMLLGRGGDYAIKDSVIVKPFGINYQHLGSAKPYKSDTFSLMVNRLIEEDIKRDRRCYSSAWQISREYQHLYQRDIYGRIKGKKGIPLENVHINAPGTEFATQTSEDGTFKMAVPGYVQELNIHAKGYYSRTLTITEEEDYELFMTPISFSSGMVHGIVTDAETGEPLPGVTVLVKGTSTGTITDLDGYYQIRIPEFNPTLVFSYVGYLNEEAYVSGTYMDIQLSADILMLEDIVVVGYGVQKKSNLTGTVSTVVSESLLGTLAGVNTSQKGIIDNIQMLGDVGQPGSALDIQIRGISSSQQLNNPIIIIDGLIFNGDPNDLDASFIQEAEVLKDAAATAIYGSRGANGVLLITTKKGAVLPESLKSLSIPAFTEEFYQQAGEGKSLRRNFSDYAFWEPTLITDENGEASFDVTFPDDVTQWDTYVLAMTKDKKSGQTSGSIKSFKPVMAKLSTPRFLVEKDTAFALGKIVNYTPDSIQVHSSFKINGTPLASKNIVCNDIIIDTLQLIGSLDSLNVSYSLELPNGYSDGELREIPVYRSGLEEAHGSFHVLDRDTMITERFDSLAGTLHIYARADELDVIDDEISHVLDYKYWCNEQIASKLKALLAEKTIYEYKGKEFKNNQQIDKLIKLLEKNQGGKNLWGWWKHSPVNYWISQHVLEALVKAKDEGYAVNYNSEGLAQTITWDLENDFKAENAPYLLRLAALLELELDYSRYYIMVKKIERKTLEDHLNFIRLSQILQMPVNTDTLKYWKKETMFGNTYYQDSTHSFGSPVNTVILNTLAYEILKSDSMSSEDELRKIRNYFFEMRKAGYWENTYQSARVIDAILPDLLGDTNVVTPSLLEISGDVDTTFLEFPCELELENPKYLEFRKEGDFPVYLSNYVRVWNENPVAAQNDFVIHSFPEGGELKVMKAGEPTTLHVSLTVKKQADFVMVNIPIPAGCSYGKKIPAQKNEAHREYFKNEVAVFYETLPEGKYEIVINLLPRYSGSYTLNPAKAELMYFPVFRANEEMKRVSIE